MSSRAEKSSRPEPETWFQFSIPAGEGELSAEQLALLSEAREMLARLNPARARNTWAVLYGGLVLAVPLDRKPDSDRITSHESVQLYMGEYRKRVGIAGAWQDAHYAWENPVRTPAFWTDGHDRAARASALDWLVREIRRPITRLNWRMRRVPAGFFDPW